MKYFMSNAEERKLTLIVNHMMQSFFEYKIHNMSIDIKYDELESYIVMTGSFSGAIDPQRLFEVNQALLTKRTPEIEDYYEELLGVEFADNSLTMLGSMIDFGEVKVEGDQLKMTVRRKH